MEKEMEKIEKVNMEKLLSRIESLVEKYVQDFEDNPLTQSIKILIILWIFKKCYRLIKEA
ncbi:MAG: hypothetical protein GY782_08585 [Gammaproteobacteria bacterium]|nr:hypothetical protein [Gammaproteobacteria bacterium]